MYPKSQFNSVKAFLIPSTYHDFLKYNLFQVNRTRNQNRIYVHGTDVPEPVCTFEELQTEYRLNPRILQNLQEAGLSSPTPIQMQAVPLMMHVSSVQGTSQHGQLQNAPEHYRTLEGTLLIAVYD